MKHPWGASLVLGAGPGPRADDAKPARCKYEKNFRCAVPGITLRWKAAYRMAVEQTDDLEQAGVQRCLAAGHLEDVVHATARKPREGTLH